MMASKSQKVFVEPDEEIVFTVEKILKHPSNKVILIIPQKAALISSAVSLKILTRQLLSTDKLVVLVADTEVGRKLADKAGLVAVNKISEVDKDLWHRVKDLKDKLIEERLRIKQELLGDRNPQDDVSNREIKEDKVKAKIIDSEKDEELIPKKKRLDDKIVDLKGITIVAGGDITKHKDVFITEQTKLGDEPDSAEFLEQYQPEVKHADFKNQKQNLRELKEEAEEEMREGDIKEKTEQKSFIGRDLTAMLPSKAVSARGRGVKSQQSPLKKYLELAKVNLAKLSEGGNTKKIIQIFVIVMVVFFLVSYIFLPAVSVTLVFAKNEVRVNENLTADVSVDDIDSETLTIPARPISKTLSTSADGEATGEGEVGDKAKGLIDIFNNMDEEVTLSAGTTVTNISTDLSYTINNSVTVPKNDSVPDIAITASKIGENYNLSDDRDFKISGYTTSDLYGRNFNDITGGTSEDVIVVSQADIDSVKATAREDLRQQLIDSVNSLITDNEDILIVETFKFTEDEFSSSVKAGKETETFSVDLKMTLSALAIKISDLSLIADSIVREQEELGEQGSVEIVGMPQVRSVNVANKTKKFDFQLSARTAVTADINEDELKEQLAGVSVGEARDFLRELDGLEDFRLKYTPSYIPFFLQRIPNDQAKIEIVKTLNGEE